MYRVFEPRRFYIDAFKHVQHLRVFDIFLFIYTGATERDLNGDNVPDGTKRLYLLARFQMEIISIGKKVDSNDIVF